MKKSILIIIFSLFVFNVYSQSSLCADADPFCTDSSYSFPLAYSNIAAESGPDYNCLLTQPDPVWYFLQISQAGDIGINMASTPGTYDIDFCCWGPFTSATGACTAGLTSANVVDCSYTMAAIEDCDIPNAQVGEFYMFVLTNFSNQTTDVAFSQTSGTGETDCSIVAPCSMTNITVNVGACDPATSTYDITGTIVYIDAPATGELIIEDTGGPSFFDSSTPNPNFISPTNFSITDIPADGLQHDLFAYFTDDLCNYTINYNAPASCAGVCATPPGTITASTPSCHDSPVTFTYNPGTVNPGASYDWDFGTGATPATANTVGPHNVTYSTPGSSPNITLTVTDPGCTADIINASVNIPTQITVSNSTSTPENCNLSDGTISLTAIGGTGTLNYDIGTGSNTSGNFSSLLAGAYTATITDDNGCTITEAIAVSQSSGASINSETSSDVSCAGYNDGSVIVSASGGTAPLSYSIGSTSNTTGSFTGLGGNTYTVTVTDASGCTIVSSALVVNEPAGISIDSQASSIISCYGYNDGSINITASGGAGGLTYSIDGIPQANGDFTNLVANSYTVTITDINGCTTSTGFSLTEPQEILVSSTASQIICSGQTATISVSVMGGNQPYTYFWSHASINSPTISVSPSNETIYSVYVQDANGCISENANTTISVSPSINLDVLPNTENVCPGDPAAITLAPSGGIGPPYMTYVDNNIQNSPYIVYPFQTTTYNVTAIDACGSTANGTVTINVYDLPPISFHADTLSGCQPLFVTFNETTPDIGQTYAWNFGDSDHNNLAFTKSPTHEYEDAGSYTVTLTVVSAEGCSNTQVEPYLITVYPSPTAKFIVNPEVVSVIKPIVNFTNLSLLNYNNYWYFGDGDSSNAINPIHIYQQYPTGTYNVELIAETNHGCRDSTFTYVQVENEYTFYAPTAFSPDFDGINDVFNVKGNGIDPRQFQMYIYDRWGEIIFETEDLHEGWDGRANGGDIGKNAVYTWLVIYKDTKSIEHQEAGAVTIIR